MAADDSECIVHVVNAISGESFARFRLPSLSTVLQVKRCVQAAHDIGVFCQRLLLWPVGRPLQDPEVLAALPGLPLGSCDAQVTLALVRLDYIEADADTVGQLLRAAQE
eukprot:6279822-Heterocapsa_arctica.AAC.1